MIPLGPYSTSWPCGRGWRRPDTRFRPRRDRGCFRSRITRSYVDTGFWPGWGVRRRSRDCRRAGWPALVGGSRAGSAGAAPAVLWRVPGAGGRAPAHRDRPGDRGGHCQPQGHLRRGRRRPTTPACRPSRSASAPCWSTGIPAPSTCSAPTTTWSTPRGPASGWAAFPEPPAPRGYAAGASAYIVRFAPRQHRHPGRHGHRRSRGPAGGANVRRPGSSAPAAPPAPAGPSSREDLRRSTGAVADQTGAAAVSGAICGRWSRSGAHARCSDCDPVVDRVPKGSLTTTVATLPGRCADAAVEAGGGPGRRGDARPRNSLPGPGRARAPARAACRFPAPTRPPPSFRCRPRPGRCGTWPGARRAGRSSGSRPPGGRGSRPGSPISVRPPSPVSPVESAGLLYTLDQAAPGQPTLWTIQPTTGAMIPVAGSTRLSGRQRRPRRPAFGVPRWWGSGPRVVFNNPGSLLAVVVFTDGSHAPVIVDKRSAVVVSATGPALVNPAAPVARSGSRPTGPSSNPARPVPVAARSARA